MDGIYPLAGDAKVLHRDSRRRVVKSMAKDSKLCPPDVPESLSRGTGVMIMFPSSKIRRRRAVVPQLSVAH